MSDTSRSASSICTICYKKAGWGEWALSMVGVEEGREFRFRWDLYSQESTFPLVVTAILNTSLKQNGKARTATPIMLFARLKTNGQLEEEYAGMMSSI